MRAWLEQLAPDELAGLLAGTRGLARVLEASAATAKEQQRATQR